MQIKHHKITIKSYLDFIQLFQDYRGTHKENRLFALKHESLVEKPKEILLLWLNTHAFRKTKGLDSEKLLSNFGTANSFLGLFFLLFGFFVGMGLLSYNGVEPVNIIYYLFFAVLIPIGSMLLSLFSIFSSGKLFSIFSLFSLMHWIEKISSFFSFKNRLDLLVKDISPKLQKWIFIKRLQFLSLLFSIGLLVSLIFMVVSQDIAFSWSTTLQVDAKSFHTLLETIATPWREFLPNFVPSLELVEVSHYYRLGEHIDTQMVANSDKLGAWWKFLFMSTFVYALVLRFFFYIFSAYSFQKVLEKEFFDLGGIKKLLKEFNTSFVETKSPNRENHLEIHREHKKQVKREPKTDSIKAETKENYYHSIIAWNFSDDEILLVNDFKNIKASFISSVGGSHSFEEDEIVANRAEENVLFYVKSWEPPTMDFVDFLEELIENKNIEEIEILLVGMSEANYKHTQKEFSIWNRKIEGLNIKKVWIVDAQE